MNFAHLKKNLKKPSAGLPVIKVAVLCDFASQFLVQALEGYGIEAGVKYEVFEADYNQIDRQALDPGSELYSFEPTYVVVARSTEKLLKEFYHLPHSERAGFAARQTEYTEHLYTVITERLNCRLIINTFPAIDDGVFGNYAARLNFSFLYQVRRLNLSLMDLSQRLKSLLIADFDSIVSRIGQSVVFDPKMYINADMVFSLDALPAICKNIHDIIQAATGKFRKCLILDLDNTTWGGIIGDDGMEGIEIGSLGIGKAFANLQLWVKDLKERGILIAVASKNSEEIAREPFEKHPEMLLKLSDIALFVANWENKVDNIRHIQSVLNVSFDSMVFLDDNPFEREMVKQAIPDITVPALPEDPAEYLTFLRPMNLFETVSYTQEDRERTSQYQVETQRAVLQQSFANEDEFLQNLDMVSEVRQFDAFSTPRVAQLSQRSNQFNLRTVRYSQEEIAVVASSPGHITLSFTLEDRFGDNGLISAIILQKRNEGLFIDTWIMSCRVLKRGMENFVLNKLAETALANGFRRLIGEYIPTQKNGMVKNHYPALGFLQDQGHFILELANYQAKKTFIKTK
jgi:FkbH-like protein